jgi:hypothetical protein
MKIKRLWNQGMRNCHFCGKELKLLHKYIQLDPGYEYTYLGHQNCTFLYMITHPEQYESEFAWEKWGPPKRG